MIKEEFLRKPSEEFLRKLSEEYHRLNYMKSHEKEEVKLQADSLAFWYDRFLAGETPENIFKFLEMTAIHMGIYHTGSIGRTKLINQRSVGFGDGPPQLQLGLSRFYWMHAHKYNPGRVIKEMDLDVANGFNYARCLAQVQNLSGDTYWNGVEILPIWANHQELMRSLSTLAAQRGFRILWTLIGKGGDAADSTFRYNFVKQCAEVLKEVPDGVLAIEIINEYYGRGYIDTSEMKELAQMVEEISGIPCGTSAPQDTSPELWNEAKSPSFGIAHLDRSRYMHEPDRPWRQPWDVGLYDDRWIDNEGIGPGASVASEERPQVLRSMRLVSFICRAFATCFHADAGIRGFEDMINTPGYFEVQKSLNFLPNDLAEGNQVSSRNADSWWEIAGSEFRDQNDDKKGMIRLYSNFNHRLGQMFSVPFGLVSDVTIYAKRNMWVEILDQDKNDLLGRVELKTGDPLTLLRQTDYLLRCGTT